MNRYLIIGMLLFGCKVQEKPAAPEGSDAQVVVEIEKMGCRGYCPKYTLKLLDDQTLHFEGKRNVGMVGEYSRKLSDDEYQTTLSILQSEEVSSLDSLYDNGIVDVPFCHLKIARGESYQKTSCRGDMPKAFQRVESHLEKLGQVQNWIAEESSMQRQVIVEVTEAEAVVRLEEKYQPLSLTLQKRISPRQLYFVFDIIPTASDEETLNLLREDPDVKTVQWNRELNRRDR